MHRDSPEGLRLMNYYNEIEGFINYTLSNIRNISVCGIRCVKTIHKEKLLYSRRSVTSLEIEEKKKTIHNVHNINV